MKAVIEIGGSQYIVAKGDELVVDRMEDKKTQLEPLLVFDANKVNIGRPTVKGGRVGIEIIEPEIKGPKVKIVKFQAKKRVKKTVGHRQPQSKIRIKSISVK